uniref:Uncharacterized protein n=1 Tax=Solanum tuberosum TaxID=4113 RepID=M1C986_SOLTU
MRPFPHYLCMPTCLIKSRGQHETLCAKCSSKLFDLVSRWAYYILSLSKFTLIVSNASWTLSGDARHLLETKSMRWWGRGSLGPMDMMTSTRSK